MISVLLNEKIGKKSDSTEMEDQTKLNGLSVKFLFFIVRKMI
jgi:hypothetical protein